MALFGRNGNSEPDALTQDVTAYRIACGIRDSDISVEDLMKRSPEVAAVMNAGRKDKDRPEIKITDEAGSPRPNVEIALEIMRPFRETEHRLRQDVRFRLEYAATLHMAGGDENVKAAYTDFQKIRELGNPDKISPEIIMEAAISEFVILINHGESEAAQKVYKAAKEILANVSEKETAVREAEAAEQAKLIAAEAAEQAAKEEKKKKKKPKKKKKKDAETEEDKKQAEPETKEEEEKKNQEPAESETVRKLKHLLGIARAYALFKTGREAQAFKMWSGKGIGENYSRILGPVYDEIQAAYMEHVVNDNLLTDHDLESDDPNDRSGTGDMPAIGGKKTPNVNGTFEEAGGARTAEDSASPHEGPIPVVDKRAEGAPPAKTGTGELGGESLLEGLDQEGGP